MNDTGKKTPPGSSAVRDLAATDAGGYLGCRAAFLTQHGKEKVLAPALEAVLGCKVAHPVTIPTSSAPSPATSRALAARSRRRARRRASAWSYPACRSGSRARARSAPTRWWVSWARGEADNGCAFLETDVCAHMNPARMETIAQAAQDIARKLCTPCPACGTPGFQLAERVPGLPCEDCGAATREAGAEIHRCIGCGHQVIAERPEKAAPDAGFPPFVDNCASTDRWLASMAAVLETIR